MGKKTVLMVVAQEMFRDEELQHPLAVFKQKGFDVFIAAPENREATGMFGAKVTPDLTIADAAMQKFDALVVVGGRGARQWLWDNPTLHNMLRAHNGAGKPLGAICIGPVALARAGLLNGVEATVFKADDTIPEFTKAGVKMVEKDVVTSGTIVTGNGPAAARSFGLAVADLLGK